MRSSNRHIGKILGLATVLLLATGASSSWGSAANTQGEGKCQTTLTKALGKHAAAVTKAMAACTNSLLAGNIVGPCPDTNTQDVIDKSAAKASKSAGKKCRSGCSLSGVSCIDSDFCPPNGQSTENCNAKGNYFEASNMGFPGPFCEALIGGRMTDPEDFGACVGGLGEILAREILDNVYGDIDGTPALSDAAQGCLDAIVAAAPKSAAKMASTVAKCRYTQLTAQTPIFLPDDCPTDTKTSATVVKTRGKFVEKVAKSCTDTVVVELDLCGTGPGGIATVSAAQDCLGDLLDEVAYSVADPDDRAYADISIVNGAYPVTATARCGDNVINQLPSAFLPNGEECDGTSLADCDACLPPGDVFECTCAETRRIRTFADGLATDLDNGWSGGAHDARVADASGFVAEVSDCDCSAFSNATCIGSSTDPVCDVAAEVQPRCSQRLGDGTSCDQVGNVNGAHNDTDCQACDEFAQNSGDFCTGSARFCVGGGSSGERCNQGADCPGGTCSGIGACLDGPFVGNGCAGPQHCGVCLGGVNVGLACSSDANCPAATCEAHTCANQSCRGGTNDENPCMVDGDCPGGRCAQTTDCLSQCYDADGAPQGPCWNQSDCPAGERCRGACDRSNDCVITRNGAPLPLSAQGASVCVDTRFFSNLSGTTNVQTGEHAINYELRAVTLLAEALSSPCPVCGGWCETTGSRCSGSCSGPELECRYGPSIGAACSNNGDCGDNLCGPVSCRFDEDCPSGTCDGGASPDCLGGDCHLELTCSLGPNQGLPCRIEAATAFGTTSSDCPPNPALNVSGSGLAISLTPLTSGVVTLESPAPCDATGYQNFDCNCVTGDSFTRNEPNRCNPACNAGPSYGRVCTRFSVCVGGSEAGAACDEDTDCTGGACTGNPRVCGDGNLGQCSVSHCVGGSNPGTACNFNSQCTGGGSCPGESCTVGGAPCLYGVCNPDSCTTNSDCEPLVTCDDACPTGRCTPLCVEQGVCSGGTRNGLACALDEDCPGGGGCAADDDEEGACAQGSNRHCDGPGWEFMSCGSSQVGTKQGCEFGFDNIGGNSDDWIGAGFCVDDVARCFVNNGSAEGGSTLNGGGNPTDLYSVATYCIPPTSSNSVNATAGLPGPGRIRQPSTVAPNFTQLP